VVKRAMPATAHPEVSQLRPLRFRQVVVEAGDGVLAHVEGRQAAAQGGVDGLTGSGRPVDWSMDLEKV